MVSLNGQSRTGRTLSVPFDGLSAAAAEARDRVREVVGLDDPPTRQQMFKMMEVVMTGFMEVCVNSSMDAVKCLGCSKFCPLSQREVENIRKTTSWPTVACSDCVEKLGWEKLYRIREELWSSDSIRSPWAPHAKSSPIRGPCDV